MKGELTIAALMGPGDEVLAEVAQILRAMALPPESFVWSAIPKTPEARHWMTVPVDEAKLQVLIACLEKSQGYAGSSSKVRASLSWMRGPCRTPTDETRHPHRGDGREGRIGRAGSPT